jgi:lipopolysaccharide export system protein LptA
MNLPNIRPAALLLMALALNAGTALADRADRDKPMHLEADQVSIDDSRQVSTFEGNVQLSQGTLSIHGDKLVVVQSSDGFAHGTAMGQPASFRQKREGFDEYVEGYGNRIEYDTRNETVDFYGEARMKRNEDEVRGEHITYNAKTEIFQVQGDQHAPSDASGKGRVRVILQPKSSGSTMPRDPLHIQPSDSMVPPR